MSNSLVKGLNSLVLVNSIPIAYSKNTNVYVTLKKAPVIFSFPQSLISHKLSLLNPLSHKTVATCGISVGNSFRAFHSDVAKVPSFDDYRLDKIKDPKSNTFESEMDRKFYLYSMALAKYTIKTFIWTLGPGINAKQAGKVEIKLNTIAEGKNMIIKWRSKPLFIKHRTQEEIMRERAVPLSLLRDPETDEQRVKQDKWLVCLGVCTHLGCIPIANSGDYVGGYYCPCHGSHYDGSGRIRKGPAPKNLEVPDYTFISDDTIVVG